MSLTTGPKKLVCWDFDHTMVDIHSHNEAGERVGNGEFNRRFDGNGIIQRNKKGEFERTTGVMSPEPAKGGGASAEFIESIIAPHLKNADEISKSMKAALKNGHAVAITSFNKYPEIIEAILKKLVRPGDQDSLQEADIEKILIVAGFPSNGISNPGTKGYSGKNEHIQHAMVAAGIPESESKNVILIDDSEPNYKIAKKAGYESVHVPVITESSFIAKANEFAKVPATPIVQLQQSAQIIDVYNGKTPDELAQMLCETIRKKYSSQEAKRQEVEKLLKAGANLDYKESYAGATPLHVSCSQGSGGVGTGDPKLVTLLIEYGANPNTTDDLGRTPLHMAGMNNYADVYKYLTELDPSKNTKSGKPYIKADETIEYNYAGSLKTPKKSLDDAQAHSKSVQATNMRDALISSIQENNKKKFDATLSRLESADMHDLNGLTPLHYAAQKGNVEMIKALLAKGAQANEVAGHLHEISLPLHRAIASGNPEAVKVLLEAGADPKSKAAGEEFPSPIEFAASKPQFSQIAKLLKDGFTPSGPSDSKSFSQLPLTSGRDYESEEIGNILAKATTANPDVEHISYWELEINSAQQSVNVKRDGEDLEIPTDNPNLTHNFQMELAKHKDDVPPHTVVCYAHVGENHWATYACNTRGEILIINSLPGYTIQDKIATEAMKAAIKNGLGKDAEVSTIVSQKSGDEFYQKDTHICGAVTIEMAKRITSAPFKSQAEGLRSILTSVVNSDYSQLRKTHQDIVDNNTVLKGVEVPQRAVGQQEIEEEEVPQRAVGQQEKEEAEVPQRVVGQQAKEVTSPKVKGIVINGHGSKTDKTFEIANNVLLTPHDLKTPYVLSVDKEYSIEKDVKKGNLPATDGTWTSYSKQSTTQVPDVAIVPWKMGEVYEFAERILDKDKPLWAEPGEKGNYFDRDPDLVLVLQKSNGSYQYLKGKSAQDCFQTLYEDSLINEVSKRKHDFNKDGVPLFIYALKAGKIKPLADTKLSEIVKCTNEFAGNQMLVLATCNASENAKLDKKVKLDHTGATSKISSVVSPMVQSLPPKSTPLATLTPTATPSPTMVASTPIPAPQGGLALFTQGIKGNAKEAEKVAVAEKSASKIAPMFSVSPKPTLNPGLSPPPSLTFTPSAKSHGSSIQEVVIDPYAAFKHVAEKVMNYNDAKKQELGIKSIDSSQLNSQLPKISMEMYCNDAKNETKKIFIEPASNEGGVKYSMETSDDPVKNQTMLEKALNQAVASAQPGDLLKIPENAENKDEIASTLDKIMRTTFGDKYQPGIYKIPGEPKPADRISPSGTASP